MKISNILKKINMENINQGINEFNKAVQDFGNSMDKMTREISEDIAKSNQESEARAKKTRKILINWGKRD